MAENHTRYRGYRDLRGDGRTILYRRADNQGLNWSVRLKIPSTVGYVVKSAKTRRLSSIGSLSGYTEGNIRKIEIWALPHLGNQPVEAIKEDALAEYLQWRVDHAKKTPAISTLRNERTVLNQIFRFAKRKGYISDPPVIAIPPRTASPRSMISHMEGNERTTPLAK